MMSLEAEVDDEKLATAFVDLIGTLVGDFDVHDLLRVLAGTGAELLGTAAAGLLLADAEGRLRVAAASGEGAELLDLFQLQTQDGPCLECFRSGQAVRVEGVEELRARWPEFGDVVAVEGYGAVLALPMRLRSEVIGTLNLFGDAQSPPLTDTLVAVAQALADVATIAILQDRLARNRELVNQQLQGALQTRVVIEQAKGALAARSGLGPDEAFAILRTRARSSRRTLADVADEVVRRATEE